MRPRHPPGESFETKGGARLRIEGSVRESTRSRHVRPRPHIRPRSMTGHAVRIRTSGAAASRAASGHPSRARSSAEGVASTSRDSSATRGPGPRFGLWGSGASGTVETRSARSSRVSAVRWRVRPLTQARRWRGGSRSSPRTRLPSRCAVGQTPVCAGSAADAGGGEEKPMTWSSRSSMGAAAGDRGARVWRQLGVNLVVTDVSRET